MGLSGAEGGIWFAYGLRFVTVDGLSRFHDEVDVELVGAERLHPAT
jgi:hypothetical protein